MVTEITQGIKVSVETEYQPEYSNPENKHYVFTYRVSIENHSEYTVQLLRRKWLISESDGSRKQVEGEGVVGQQPVLEPGEGHQYVSGAHLKTGFGKMWGNYEVERMLDGDMLQVAIPEFNLIVPYRMN